MKHAKAIISIIVIIAMATGMTGCHTNHGVVNLTEEITPSGTDTESSGETAVSQNEFAYKLFKECYREGENTLISPMSVFFALAVTANGARGETLDEILDLISDKASTEELNELCRAYKNLLSAEELKTADSVWMRDDNYLTINQDFLQTVKEFYSADVFKFFYKTVDNFSASFGHLLHLLNYRNAVYIARIRAQIDFIIPHLITVDIRINIPGYTMSIIDIDTAEIFQFDKRLKYRFLF